MEPHELTSIAASNVRKILKHRSMTQRQLAEASGLFEPDVSKLLRASKFPGERLATGLGTLSKIAAALGVSVVELIDENYSPPILLRGTVGASPFDKPDVYDEPQVFEPKRYPPECFALTVTGPSCTRFGIADGDVVIVRPATSPEEGRFVVVRNEEGHTLKAYYRGKLWRFLPEDIEPVAVATEASTGIVGVVVGKEGEPIYRPDRPAKKPKK